jgi:hypothetical protein
MAIEAESVALEADIKKMCDVEVWRESAWSRVRVLIFFLKWSIVIFEDKRALPVFWQNPPSV